MSSTAGCGANGAIQQCLFMLASKDTELALARFHTVSAERSAAIRAGSAAVGANRVTASHAPTLPSTGVAAVFAI